MGRHVAEKLQERGVMVPPYGRVELDYTGKGTPPDLVEPEALPLLDLARESLTEPCPRCGRQPGGFREFLVPSGAAMPVGVDICRARNCPTIYIVSEGFAEAVNARGLSGYVLRQLDSV